ncbi:MAG: ABC transporter permease/substrate-binding protein [Bacteroidota bacterium]
MNEILSFFTGHAAEIWSETLRHIWLTLVSLFLAVIVGVLTGIFLTRKPSLSGSVIGIVNVIQTIPSLALLGFLLPFLGIGVFPSVIALFLYSLLPIVRNTFAGIMEVPASVKEAGLGMGLTKQQLLMKVELPLAVPVIFAGIRTATVVCVGVATLCALIASGGLGAFIYRGIALNNSAMIFAGALPAALLALLFDLLLGLVQKNIKTLLKPVLVVSIVLMFFLAGNQFYQSYSKGFTGGFQYEFMERRDGLSGLLTTYGFQLSTVELDVGLMYQAVQEGRVDVIGGYSTDGRIDAYELLVLEDDLNYFPPYQAAVTINANTLENYPYLTEVLNQLAGLINDEEMRQLNYQVDFLKQDVRKTVVDFLKAKGFKTDAEKNGQPDIAIGGKIFTEHFILAEMLKVFIENNTSLTVETKTGLGGTKICFEALKTDEIDLYVEYTGTGLEVLLKPEEQVIEPIIRDQQKVYDYVKENSEKEFGIIWLKPLGFNNTYALMMRKDKAKKLGIKSISDLKEYLTE